MKILLPIFILLYLCESKASYKKSFDAHKGTLDLSGWNFKEKKVKLERKDAH